ncbi:MAG: hypothetical protein U0893_28060 [Chloroflexota bacterium]
MDASAIGDGDDAAPGDGSGTGDDDGDGDGPEAGPVGDVVGSGTMATGDATTITGDGDATATTYGGVDEGSGNVLVPGAGDAAD